MSDAETLPRRVRPDAHQPHPHYMRLTDAAITRARERLNVHTNQQIAEQLGFANTAALWRARHGYHNTPLDQVLRICRLLGMEVTDVFAMPVGSTRPIRRDPATRKLIYGSAA